MKVREFAVLRISIAAMGVIALIILAASKYGLTRLTLSYVCTAPAALILAFFVKKYIPRRPPQTNFEIPESGRDALLFKLTIFSLIGVLIFGLLATALSSEMSRSSGAPIIIMSIYIGFALVELGILKSG